MLRMDFDASARQRAEEWAQLTFAQFYAVCTRQDIAEHRAMLEEELRAEPSKINRPGIDDRSFEALLAEVLDAYEARLGELLARASGPA